MTSSIEVQSSSITHNSQIQKKKKPNAFANRKYWAFPFVFFIMQVLANMLTEMQACG